MKLLMFLLLTIPAIVAPCQQFQKRYDIVLNDSISSARSEWADLDNDGLLDIFLISTTHDGANYLQFVKGDNIGTPLLHTRNVPTITSITSHVITDYNHDNKMDVVISGMTGGLAATIVYINRGSFLFEEKILPIGRFSILTIADLDNDARAEWLVSGVESGAMFFRILSQRADLPWSIVHDSLKILATSVQVFDGNGDGRPDLFISGKAGTDSLVSCLMLNRGKLSFTPTVPVPQEVYSSPGDFNYDGFFDFLTIGVNQNAGHVTNRLESGTPTYTWKEIAPVINEGISFAGDLNSDGLIDVSYFGKGVANNDVNVIQYTSKQQTLVSQNVVHTSFGDEDRDGDLDQLIVIKNNGVRLECYRNEVSEKNLAPSKPRTGIAVNIYDRTLIYWDRATDDHTNSKSITYDLSPYGNDNFLAGSFDKENQSRLLTAHGNNGTENFKLIRNGDALISGFTVQAVDNAFYGGALCKGVGSSCATVTKEMISLCSGERITLKAPSTGLWFSFAKGYLGQTPELDIQFLSSDTVFHINPTPAGCASVKIWDISIYNDTLKTETGDRYGCEGEQLQLNVESGWSQVEWKSQLHGQLGTSSGISYTTLQNDSITVTLTNSAGCKLVRRTAIKIGHPDVQVAVDNFKIAKGSSVRLLASGAQRYEWTPPTPLDNPNSADPVASPVVTTLFTVTGFDSLNCQAKATVNVIIEDGGFIPNLFTPNDDGKNDDVRIYGLSSARDFLFTIYNREGSLVFRTSDLREALSSGWDGKKNGTNQPPGVYFWKVRGVASSGEGILLNGKDTGSIVLVR